jgi:hypothetical protein
VVLRERLRLENADSTVIAGNAERHAQIIAAWQLAQFSRHTLAAYSRNLFDDCTWLDGHNLDLLPRRWPGSLPRCRAFMDAGGGGLHRDSFVAGRPHPVHRRPFKDGGGALRRYPAGDAVAFHHGLPGTEDPKSFFSVAE